MWNSHESVYSIIKPPEAFKPRTPPPTAKELRDRRVAFITRKLKLQMKQKLAATFGRPVGSFKPCTGNFLKKHSKEPVVVYGQQRCTKHVKRKPEVPRERPVYGRVKVLDFIKMNAEQMIHSKPNRSQCPKKMKRYVMKKSYGKLPLYLQVLTTRMKQLAEQKKDSPEEQAKCKHEGTRKCNTSQVICTKQNCQHQGKGNVLKSDKARESNRKFLSFKLRIKPKIILFNSRLLIKLDEKDRITMMNNLKLKWADTNRQYQQQSVVLDMISKIRRKEIYEANLAQLERDVSLLSRKVILVSDSTFPKVEREVPLKSH